MPTKRRVKRRVTRRDPVHHPRRLHLPELRSQAVKNLYEDMMNASEAGDFRAVQELSGPLSDVLEEHGLAELAEQLRDSTGRMRPKDRFESSLLNEMIYRAIYGTRQTEGEFEVGKTYEIVTPESAEDGEAFEQGWTFEPTVMTLRETLREIEELGGFEPSDWPMTAEGSQLSLYQSDGDIDYQTGAETREALHIRGREGAMRRLRGNIPRWGRWR